MNLDDFMTRLEKAHAELDAIGSATFIARHTELSGRAEYRLAELRLSLYFAKQAIDCAMHAVGNMIPRDYEAKDK